ncbi:alpha/beta hydrolase [Pseudomonas fluorescens]|nr:alpha/beta hydrolase [Pseudomonas fluorescens]OPB09469.1 alpha/beta hydrolase [Pseudomonas fluorescens]OPB21314.1 alpha/beta hydrolase [Pseudomonas fluorescens]
MKTVKAGVLEIAYLEVGPVDGAPVVLLHGFPYDVHAFDDVAHILASAGKRCFTPYLRGYGPTTFLDKQTMRSGEQAAIGADLLAFLDALNIEKAVLAGYDWGGRGACIVAALWPERVKGLLSCGGYSIQNIAQANQPVCPEAEHLLWYQYYLHASRGRAGLTANRKAFCRLLWRMWSPTWEFTQEAFETTAAAFENDDFVDVVIHSYRHRFGLVEGDPAYRNIESRLAAQPKIAVPSLVLEGGVDAVDPPVEHDPFAAYFTGPYRREVLENVGHNVPQEAPEKFADGVLSLAD